MLSTSIKQKLCKKTDIFRKEIEKFLRVFDLQ